MLARMIGRFLAAALFWLAASTATAQAQTSTTRATAVVELYTSQGCSQCPRANRLVGMFAGEEEGVLALTFAVPIWDYLGWRDTFAEEAFADRQRAYSRTLRVRGRYTPALVINGGTVVSASYWDEAREAVTAARQTPLLSSPSISITPLRYSRVRVAIGASTAPRTNIDVWLVSYDRGPIAEYVTRGVNLNRRVYHYNLVRTMDRLGAWNGSAVWFEHSRCRPECAVLLQEQYGGRIIAAASISTRD
jgi:hypothetical protein